MELAIEHNCGGDQPSYLTSYPPRLSVNAGGGGEEKEPSIKRSCVH